MFFYGTLMTGFDLRQRTGLDDGLRLVERGSIQGQLFDLGPYPAAVPSAEGRIWGEVYEIRDPAVLLATLDEVEGYRGGDPDRSMYVRGEAAVRLDTGRVRTTWAYFYNAALDQDRRIVSGDYREHVNRR